MWKGRAESSRRSRHLSRGWKLSSGSLGRPERGRSDIVTGGQPTPNSTSLLFDVPDDKGRNVPPDASYCPRSARTTSGRGEFIEAWSLTSSLGCHRQSGKAMDESRDADPSTDCNDSIARIDITTHDDNTISNSNGSIAASDGRYRVETAFTDALASIQEPND